MLSNLEARILKVIRDSHEISRLEISKLLNLSKPVISQIVTQLIEKGLVEESGISKSSSGRPRIKLKFFPDAWYCIGAELEENYLEVIITDLSGAITLSFREKTPSIKESAEIASWCAQRIKQLMEKSSISQQKILGVGVGISGMVDPNTEIVRTAPAFGMKTFNLKAALERDLKMPVCVANRVKLAALAEYMTGAAKGFSDLLFVFLDSGLGSAVITGDQLFQGYFGKSGEFGWMLTDIDLTKDDICQEQEFGHLARKISGHSLKRFLEMTNGVELDYIMRNLADERSETKIIRKSLLHLIAAIANAILMFDPQMVIIKGRIGQKYFNELSQFILPHLKRMLPSEFHENLQLRCGEIEEFDVALGGVFLVQKKLMNI
ncbi:MAG: ROK family transcriptional regulator [Pseudothermotoga sp.]